MTDRKTMLLWGVAVAGFIIMAGGLLQQYHSGASSGTPITSAPNGAFSWSSGAAGGQLVLAVHGNPGLANLVTAPIVPADGTVRVTGGRGAAMPGAIVQVLNGRSRATATAIAGPDGAFELTASALKGDVLTLLAMQRPRVIAAPDAVLAADVVQSR